MNLVMEKFYQHFTEIYGDSDEKFIEKQGRKIFLLYLKPIINGTEIIMLKRRQGMQGGLISLSITMADSISLN